MSHEIVSPRDPATGLPTGKRQHKPLTIRMEVDKAIPKLQDATGGNVEGMLGDSEPLVAIEDAINLHGFDEIILSTLPWRISER